MGNPALVGALVGLAVGVVDYLILSRIIRATVEKESRKGTVVRGGAARVDLLLRIVFVINVLLFTGLGLWVGSNYFG